MARLGHRVGNRNSISLPGACCSVLHMAVLLGEDQQRKKAKRWAKNEVAVARLPRLLTRRWLLVNTDWILGLAEMRTSPHGAALADASLVVHGQTHASGFFGLWMCS